MEQTGWVSMEIGSERVQAGCTHPGGCGGATSGQGAASRSETGRWGWDWNHGAVYYVSALALHMIHCLHHDLLPACPCNRNWFYGQAYVGSRSQLSPAHLCLQNW